MYIGGRWGKKTHPGDMVDRLFSKEELMTVIEKAILLFREKGKPGERFSSTIERIGLSEFTKELLSDDVLLRKSAILA